MGVRWNTQRNWVTGLEVKDTLEKVVPTADPDEEEVGYEKEPSDEEE